MATQLPVSAIILWFAFALSALSICHGAVRDIATQDFFNGIISATAADSCPGKTFYKYSDFIDAANLFPSFGTTGTSDDTKREIAAFFGNVAHETTNLCFVEENAKSDNCDSTNTQYPCASGQQYYGRGPLQLTGNGNYGAAGSYLNVDLLKNPGLVAQDDLISWKTALWFWNANCHTAITSGQGFGATIKAINGPVECNGKVPNEVNDRISHYTNYCSQFGVDPGSNLSC